MLDLRLVRDNTEFVRERLRRRSKPEALRFIDEALALDEERRALITDVDRLRARRNEVSVEVGKLKKAGRNDEAEPLILEMREVGDQQAALEARRTAAEEAVQNLLL